MAQFMKPSEHNAREHFEQIILEHYECGYSWEQARHAAITSECTQELDNLFMIQRLEDARQTLWEKQL